MMASKTLTFTRKGDGLHSLPTGIGAGWAGVRNV